MDEDSSPEQYDKPIQQFIEIISNYGVDSPEATQFMVLHRHNDTTRNMLLHLQELKEMIDDGLQ